MERFREKFGNCSTDEFIIFLQQEIKLANDNNQKQTMSNYKRITKHPITGEWKMADWLDDFFGIHRYAVVFDIDNKKEIFKEDDYEWETKDEMDSDTTQLKAKILSEIEVAKSAMHGGGNHRMVMEKLIDKIKKY